MAGGILVVFEAPGRENAAGFHTTAPEPKRAHFSPGSENTTKISRKTRREGRKNENCGQKERILRRTGGEEGSGGGGRWRGEGSMPPFAGELGGLGEGSMEGGRGTKGWVEGEGVQTLQTDEGVTKGLRRPFNPTKGFADPSTPLKPTFEAPLPPSPLRSPFPIRSAGRFQFFARTPCCILLHFCPPF